MNKNKTESEIYTIISRNTGAENLTLPNPQLLFYYKDLDNRMLWLQEEVDDYSLLLAKQIIEFNRQDKDKSVKDRKSIILMINSPGGSLEINNSLCNTIEMSKTPVIGVNVGQACSAACYIFMSCKKRYAFPNAQFLLHAGSAENISGTYDQVVSYVLEYQRQVENLYKYILNHSKITQKELEQQFGGDWWLSVDEAINYGFCDKKIKSLDEII